MKKSVSGFTIVELLIVIVVIAILAAITIIAYNGVQNRAQVSALQADFSNAKKKLLLYQVDNTQYPSTVPQLTAAGVAASRSAYDTTGNNFYYCFNLVTKEFAMGGRTAVSKTAYILSSTSGMQAAPGGVGADQVCQSIGLTGYTDVNAWSTNGYQSGVGWSSWVD